MRAAVTIAIGLALALQLYKITRSLDVDSASQMRG